MESNNEEGYASGLPLKKSLLQHADVCVVGSMKDVNISKSAKGPLW